MKIKCRFSLSLSQSLCDTFKLLTECIGAVAWPFQVSLSRLLAMYVGIQEGSEWERAKKEINFIKLFTIKEAKLF